MNSKLTKFAQAATLTLAITITACEEKKKQDGTTASEPAAEAATQEALAEKPAEKACGGDVQKFVIKGGFVRL